MSVVLYDDVNLTLIPTDAEAVAGYVNGRWPTYAEVVKRWPRAHHLSITVNSSGDADCLDVEPGDATNTVAPVWVHRRLIQGHKRPVVYTSVSNAQSLLRELARKGITRNEVRLWTAHYTGHAHLCGPACGFGLKTTADATQWTDRAFGRSLDQSLCTDSFFVRIPKPLPPKPTPKPTRSKPFIVRAVAKDGSTEEFPSRMPGFLKVLAQFRRGKFKSIEIERA